MNLRRNAAALAVTVVLGAAATPTAFADGSPSPKPSTSTLPKGLYGTKDPTYDGVWRQSLALLAQDAAGVTPAKSAIDWLAGQQCADGGFAAYRSDTGKPCDTAKGEFSDATGAAVQALVAVGGRAESVTKGIGWLRKTQNADGGWGMNPGNPSDANSTSAAVGAFAAFGQDPAKTSAAKGDHSPYDALLGLWLGCDAKPAERGAFAYTRQNGEPAANDLATAGAALATEGKGFVVTPAGEGGGTALKPLDCAGDAKGKGGAATGPKVAADAAAAYLASTMAGQGQHLRSALPGAKDQPDFGGTADAIVALAAGGHSKAAAEPLRWLQSTEGGAVAWAKGDPGALAKLALAAHAAGADPRDFGGVDLLRQLNATGPKPEPAAAGSEQRDQADKGGDDSDGAGVWWIVGVGLVAGVGIGFLLSGRKRQQL